MFDKLKTLNIRVMYDYQGDPGKWYYGFFNGISLFNIEFEAKDPGEDFQYYYIKDPNSKNKTWKAILKRDCGIIVPEYPAGAVEDNK